MRQIKFCILSFCICFSCSNCSNETSNRGSVQVSQNSKVDFKFQKAYFPFSFDRYNTNKLKSYFSKDISIDSVKASEHNAMFYYFKKDSSEISFIVPNRHSNFDIDIASIRSNIFKSKTGIRVGMKRAAFYKAIHRSESNVETYTITEDRLMYHFTFNSDTLRLIEIEGL